MASTINNNDPLVHYSPNGWEQQSRFGGIHAPTVNDPTGARITLEFDGTGVAVLGFLNNASPSNIQDLLRCAVDTPDIPPPTPLINAQTSTQVTVCAITSLPSTHHTLRVYPGEGANNNPLISVFVVFSDRTRTPVAPPPARLTQQTSSSPNDTSSPPPTHTSQSTPAPSSITPGSSPNDNSSPRPTHTSPSAPRPSSITSTSTSVNSAPPTDSSPFPVSSSTVFSSSSSPLPSSTTSSTSLWQDPSPTSQPQPSPNHAPSASSHTVLISTSTVGGVVLLVVVTSLVLSRLWKRRRQRHEDADAEADPAQTGSENTSIFIAPSSTVTGSRSVAATNRDGHRTPPPASRSSDSLSLDASSSHTRLVHGEVLSTAWYAPKEIQSHAQSLLRGFSAQRPGGASPTPMRDVDSGLRVHNEATLPPPYTPD